MIRDSRGSAYEALADAVVAAVAQLLMPFPLADPGDGSAPPVIPPPILNREDFFQRFLIYADRFTDQCCQELAKIIRQASLASEVRGTPTIQLAKEIRENAFRALDRVLGSYVIALREISIDLADASNKLSETSVFAEGLKGAAIGRVAGGFGKAGNVLAVVGGLAAAGTEASKQAAISQQQQHLLAQASNLPFQKITDYLIEVQSLPDYLLDYACAKCFGGGIDFTQQADAVARVRKSVDERLAQALHNVVVVPVLEQKQRDHAATLANAAAASRRSHQTNKVLALLLLAIAAVFAVIGIAQAIDQSSSYGLVWFCSALPLAFLGFGLWKAEQARKSGAAAPDGAQPPMIAEKTAKRCAYCGKDNPPDTEECQECATTEFSEQ